jgi:sirohydrochlorin cobaltochelatase
MTYTEGRFDHILLIGHGSPDPQGNAEYLTCAHLLSTQLGVAVHPCFLELASPSIDEGIRLCVEAGARSVAVLPLFLGAAGHQKNDVPAMIHEARVNYPDVLFRYGTPIGTQYLLVETLADRAAEALASSSIDIPVAETAIILVGRGSSDPDSNSEVFKMARLLWEGRNYGWVDVAFQTVTRPQVAAIIERCVLLGARRVVVVPYLLFTGFVCHDIEQQVAAVCGQHDGVEVLVARHLANHPGVINAIAQRYDDIVQGTAAMTCDICKYRYQVVGFEHDYGKPQESHHHNHHHHRHGNNEHQKHHEHNHHNRHHHCEKHEKHEKHEDK